MPLQGNVFCLFGFFFGFLLVKIKKLNDFYLTIMKLTFNNLID